MLFGLLLLSLFIPSVHATPGLRNERTVLEGVLVRAGGPGGQRSLPDYALTALCEQGVREVFYLYPSTHFSNPGDYSCAGGMSLRYRGGRFLGRGVREILESVRDNAGKGPVLVHCWNGSHAAGEVSAYALMQFCGWDGDRAARYWERTIQDPDNLWKYPQVTARIRAFRPFPGLSLAPSLQSSACP